MDIKNLIQTEPIRIKSVKKIKRGYVLEFDSDTEKADGTHFNYLLSDGVYRLRNDEEQLLTPVGIPVTTVSEALALRCIDHLNEYGVEFHAPYSVLTFLYSYIEFGLKEPREKFEGYVLSNTSIDWTFAYDRGSEKAMERWRLDFGTIGNRKPELEKWLKTLTKFQVMAVIIMGASLTSVNTAYVLSNKNKAGKLKTFAKGYERCYHSHYKGSGFYEFFNDDQLLKIFENYLFWQNLGL
jgi:hypothetical protein